MGRFGDGVMGRVGVGETRGLGDWSIQPGLPMSWSPRLTRLSSSILQNKSRIRYLFLQTQSHFQLPRQLIYFLPEKQDAEEQITHAQSNAEIEQWSKII